jgi:hypothetical protein
MEIPNINIIKVIFQFDPKIIGIGPIKINPPIFDDFLILLFLISSSIKLLLMEYLFAIPKNDNIIAINIKIKPRNVFIPEPIINGKNKTNPNSTSLFMNAVMKKNKPMKKNMKDKK